MYLFDRAEAEIRIAKNAAVLIDRLAGDHTFTLNLGNGIPSRITDFIENENVFIQAENGFLGVGPIAKEEEADWNLINANRQPVKETPGCSFFASEDAFGMMRGGHIDATALGAFSVDSDASISNWIIPNGMQLGVGGAMDLVCRTKNVIACLTHCDKHGKTKLVAHYALPVTGIGVVKYVVTEYCILRRDGSRFVLIAKGDEITLDELRAITEFPFDVAEDCTAMLK